MVTALFVASRAVHWASFSPSHPPDRRQSVWLNRLRQACVCCAQGKDVARPHNDRRCCAIGRCCQDRLSDRTVRGVRDTLRAALGNAVAEEMLTRNLAAVMRLPMSRKSKRNWWSVDEARAFLESARTDRDPL